MAKEWILNSAMNRFQLNFKRNVGPTSESIRQCAPKTIDVNTTLKMYVPEITLNPSAKSSISKLLKSFRLRLKKSQNKIALII